MTINIVRVAMSQKQRRGCSGFLAAETYEEED
jgi:hypothetical protein